MRWPHLGSLPVGARAGDIWIPDRHYDAYRWLERNEPIGLTLIQGEQSRHITVETLRDTTQAPAGLLIESWLIGPVALFPGMLIGLRQPNGLAFRAIALAMCFSVVARGNPTYVTLPAGSAFALQHLLWGPVLLAAGLAILTFVFNFPDDRPRDAAVRRRLSRYICNFRSEASVSWLASDSCRPSCMSRVRCSCCPYCCSPTRCCGVGLRASVLR